VRHLSGVPQNQRNVLGSRGQHENSESIGSAQQEDTNELQRLAVKDKVKFVKIPNKTPTDEQLEKARTLCKQPS